MAYKIHYHDTKNHHFSHAIFETYRPKFIDLFGYDISGRRKNFIITLLKHYELSLSTDEGLKKHLANLQLSLSKDKLQQDMALGMFLNYLENQGHDLSNIHESLKNLMRASKYIYRINLIKTEIECAEKEERINLIKKILKTLDDKKHFKSKVTDLLSKWLKSKQKQLRIISDSQTRKTFENMFLIVYNDLERTLTLHKNKLQHRFPPKLLKATQLSNKDQCLGEILEELCSLYAKAVSNNNHEKFFEERSKLVQSLPKHLLKLHDSYMENSIKQINASRILHVIESYKNPSKVEGKLLELLKDETIMKQFDRHIKNLVVNNKTGINWKIDFKKLIITPEFNNFLQEIKRSSPSTANHKATSLSIIK